MNPKLINTIWVNDNFGFNKSFPLEALTLLVLVEDIHGGFNQSIDASKIKFTMDSFSKNRLLD